jgi:site-specific DNA recombinase
MRVAVYARVSTTRQALAQTIEQQLDRLREVVAERGWELADQHVYRDDGYSGASLGRPGLDRLRDHAALADPLSGRGAGHGAGSAGAQLCPPGAADR